MKPLTPQEKWDRISVLHSAWLRTIRELEANGPKKGDGWNPIVGEHYIPLVVLCRSLGVTDPPRLEDLNAVWEWRERQAIWYQETLAALGSKGVANERPQPKTDKQPEPAKPRKLLKGWHKITDALNMRHAEREDIKRLNASYDGPIKSHGRGKTPMVYHEDLIEWWNTLATKQQDIANQRYCLRLSVDGQYNYSKSATVVPAIAWFVKVRRKPM